MADVARRNVAVFGSTGSIGTATLEVLKQLGFPYNVWGLTAHSQQDLLRKQILEFQPARAVLTDSSQLPLDTFADLGASAGNRTVISHGQAALEELASDPNVDIVVAGIVGSAGLPSSLAAARAGKTLALANKESLVVAGPLMLDAVKKNGARLLPIDSEHSAVFQALESGKSLDQVRRIVLTASGGSLRDMPIEKLANATVEEALNHPTWNMGRKITVDSATMMNKSLEIIEARWLFNIEPEKISVVIHPQSMIHSMVEFIDGSVIAQLSPPDMRLPIQYALTYPNRMDGPARRVDWSTPVQLDWKPADLERYPALRLGYEVAKAGGTAGAVLNGANEAAVELFLAGHIRFTEIEKVCRIVLENHTFDPSPNLDDLLSLDCWSRAEVLRWKQLEC
ncbi:MAG: 1-deoxy-D-xylulose-5-phosphate reductoisomerase [Pirellulaceae bacterium]|nr:1-deoxy-D-xylulose-5-phosphate reductoisomerase [Pirellulaceae bacterium]